MKDTKQKKYESIQKYYDIIMIIYYDVKLTSKHSTTKIKCNSLM
jgi:hypothetical protein